MIVFEARLGALEKIAQELKSGHEDLTKEIQSNSASTSRVEYNTAQLVNIFQTARGVTRRSVKFGLWLGTTLKYVGGIALAVGAIWAVAAAFISGKPPGLH